MESVEQPNLWRPTALRQHHQLGGGLFTLQMRQNSLDKHGGATLASSMQRFDASTMILTCPLQRSQVSMGPPPDRSECGPIEHPFEPLHLYALRVQVTTDGARRASCPASSPLWVHPAYAPCPSSPALPAHGTCYWVGRHSDEHPMTNSSGMNLDSFSWPAKRASIRDDTSKASQICAWLRYQGSLLRNEVQRRKAAPLKYHMRGSVPVRCLSGAA
jgi:hypothetical protein